MFICLKNLTSRARPPEYRTSVVLARCSDEIYAPMDGFWSVCTIGRALPDGKGFVQRIHVRSGKLRKPDLSILILGQTHAWKCCIPDSRFESVIAMYRISVTASESARSPIVQQRKVPRPAAFRLSSTFDRAPFSFASSGWVKMMSTSLDSALPLRYPPTIVYSAPGCAEVSPAQC